MSLTSISYLGQVRIGLCLAFLIYASVIDIKIGYVSNRYWAVTVACAILTATSDCLLSGQISVVTGTGLSFILTSFVALAMFRIGLFGGSDAKAMILLSLFIPTAYPYLGSSEVPIITSLSTAVNLVALLGLIFGINALRNVYYLRRKDQSLMNARQQGKLSLLLIFGYKRTEANKRICIKIGKSGRREERLWPNATNLAKGGCGSSHTKPDRSMAPLRIPLIMITTLSLLISLFIGDLSMAFVP